MNPIFRAAVDVQRFCDDQKWRFCLIGALAVIRWGEPRLAQDVEIQAFAGRDKDWLDVEGIILRQAPRLDTGLIIEELGPLLDLKGTTEDLARLQGLFREA